MQKYTPYTIEQVNAALISGGLALEACAEFAKVRDTARSSRGIYVDGLNGTVTYRVRGGEIRCDVSGPDGQDFGSPVADDAQYVMTAAHVAEAQRVVAVAGQGGGIDEVARLAERGWPENRSLDNDSLALRAAIIREAKWVLAGEEAEG